MKIHEYGANYSGELILGTADRSNYDILYDQKKMIEEQPLLTEFLNAVPVYITILNKHRQIVFANKALKDYLHQSQSELLGKRPGEAVSCIHSRTGRGGCGTSSFCRNCGALHAITNSYKGVKSVEECRISLREHHSLDLLVWATPVSLKEHDFTIFTMSDISSDNRRKALERIFFHDILNTAGGLQGFIDLLRYSEPGEMKEFIDISETLVEKLIDEIKAQQTLTLAENGELKINISPFSTREILEEVKILYCNHDVAVGKHIEIRNKTADILIKSDKTILRRILGNLTKNALEASKESEIVFVSCRIVDDFVEFQVENPSFIAEDIQMQLFQRSFSTKGYGRGLGTYSVKMLTEKYLKGEIKFLSTPEEGTIFTVKYPKEISD